MATHSSTLAWKIPWTEEPGRPCSPWGREESDMTEWLHFNLISGMKEGVYLCVCAHVHVHAYTCMYVYMYMHMQYTCAYVYMCSCTHVYRLHTRVSVLASALTYTRVQACTHMPTHVRTCTHVSAYVLHVYAYVHCGPLHTCMYVQVYRYMCSHTHVCIYVHVCAHAHVHAHMC